MNIPATMLISVVALSAPALANAASVELRGVYANVVVIPEDRADVAVDVHATDGKFPNPRITRSGDSILVDGGLDSRMNHCSSIHPGRGVRLPGYGWMSAGSALKITVHTPRNVHLTSSGAVLGDVQAAQGVELNTNGCSDWHFANVGGTLSVRQEGAASITAGSAGKMVFDLSGFTHVDLAETHSLKVDLSGMGKVNLKSISGPVDANLSGMGSVDIDSGRAEHVQADVSGVGAFRLHGSASDLDATVSGIGGVHVDHVLGVVHKSVSGIGHVTVG
jgi:hypothetical protein